MLNLNTNNLKDIPIGATILLSGTIYTARDAVHKRIEKLIKDGGKNPLQGKVIYHAGPCPAKPNQPIGSVGPTTSYRMDSFAKLFIDTGCYVSIGKGKRDSSVIEYINSNGGVHLEAIGGAGAYYKNCVKSCSLFMFEELGAEAIYQLEVVDFPCVRLY